MEQIRFSMSLKNGSSFSTKKSHLKPFIKKKKKEVEMLLKAPTLQASIIHALIHGIWHDT